MTVRERNDHNLWEFFRETVIQILQYNPINSVQTHSGKKINSKYIGIDTN